MRFAYADPPYLGCCGLYDHRHEDPWGCWDLVRTHQQLIDYLFHGFPEGWVLSASSSSLRTLLPYCPEETIPCVWTKGWCSWKPGAHPKRAWEPVLLFRGRKPGRLTGTRDWFQCNITTAQSVKGAKPAPFCRWVLDLLGYQDGDEVVDMFPGTGVMGRVVAQGRLLT